MQEILEKIYYRIYWLCLRINDKYHNLKHYIINCWKFREGLSSFRSWDYTGMLLLMQKSVEEMEKLHSGPQSHLLHAEKIAKDLKVCNHLLGRIIADSYILDKYNVSMEVEEELPCGGRVMKFSTSKIHDLPSVNKARKMDLRKQDIEMLTDILKRKLTHFWD
jgi:hypothetical protein